MSRILESLCRYATASIAAGLAMLHPASADTITGTIYDNTLYQQTSDNAPSGPPSYFFNVGAFFSGTGDFTGGTATFPGAQSPATLSLVGPTQLNFSSGFYSSLASLHSDFSFGTYTITATGPSGPQTSAVNYTADLFTSSVPYVKNLSSLNGANPAANIPVSYNGFGPLAGASFAFIFFTIYNSADNAVFSDEFQPDTSISAVIPAGTLAANTSYTYELDYSSRFDAPDNVDGTFTEQGFDVRTDGSFTTGAAVTPLPPTWTVLLLGLAGFALIGYRRSQSRPSNACG